MTDFPKQRRIALERIGSIRVALHDWVSALFPFFGATACFQIYGKGRAERDFRIIHVYATSRRNRDSRWPLFRGVCITWTSSAIAIGWDFAQSLLEEQHNKQISPENPVTVCSGRLSDPERRNRAGGPTHFSASELMAHECGHTAQARRMGGLYWLIGAALTRFREGNRFWNQFENEASAIGVYGGIVLDSLTKRYTNSQPALPKR